MTHTSDFRAGTTNLIYKVENLFGDLKMSSLEIAMGAALAFGFGAIGTAWAQSRIGSAGAGAIAEKPELAGSIIILEALPETMVILGFVIAAMIILMVK